MKALQLSLLLFCIYLAANASASPDTRVVRATELGSSIWTDLSSGAISDLIVEFRKGDEIPVSLTSKGDLLETVTVGASYVSVKRNFWIRVGAKDKVEMSLDGLQYKSLQEQLTGSLTAGASLPNPGQPVNAINLIVESRLK